VRAQEIVVIGQTLDQKALTDMLDNCLLSESELALGFEYWADRGDSLPVWEI
jgi:hypothetical protein